MAVVPLSDLYYVLHFVLSNIDKGFSTIFSRTRKRASSTSCTEFKTRVELFNIKRAARRVGYKKAGGNKRNNTVNMEWCSSLFFVNIVLSRKDSGFGIGDVVCA